MDILKIPRPQNELKSTPGFDTEYFSGLNANDCRAAQAPWWPRAESYRHSRSLPMSPANKNLTGENSIGDMERVNILQG